jgi:hypothetical protein
MSGPLGWLPPYDDAYITLTSAQALWSGSIPNYPGTPALHGITSPVHVVLVAALLPFASPLTALWASQVIATVVYASGLWALARAWSLTRAQAAWFVIIGITAGMVPHHLFNGLETGLVLGAVTWALALTTRRVRAAAVLLGILPFIRPELGVLSVALAGWLVYDRPAAEWGRAVMLIVAGALPWAALIAWQLGTVLPTSAPAKAAFLTDRCLPVVTKSAIAFIALASWSAAVGPAALGVVGAWRSRLARVCLAAFVIAVGAYAAGLPSQILRYHEQRYLYAWLPVLLIGGLAALQPHRRAVAVALPLIAIVGLLRLPAVYAQHRMWADAFLPEEQSITAWLHDQVPDGSRLMVIDAGYLAFASDYPLVDAVGLKSPASAVEHQRVTLPTCGRDRGAALGAIARDTGAAYFVSWGEWETTMHLAGALRASGWTVEPVRSRPAHAVGDWWYPVFRLSPPKAS